MGKLFSGAATEIYLQVYAHSSAEHMTKGTVLHFGHPAVDNDVLTFVYLHSTISQLATNALIKQVYF